MKKITLLQQLKSDMEKSSYIKYKCIFNEEKVVDKQLCRQSIEKIIEYNCNEVKRNIINLDEIEYIEDSVNCDNCQTYKYTHLKEKNIKDYKESTIVIYKKSLRKYIIDINIKQLDNDTNIEYENNKQYNIELTF